MIKELLIYPDERILTPCSDVRTFDEKLFGVLSNMRDTMEANNLDALSALQIAIPYNIVVINHNGVWLEYINPRIIRVVGKMQSIEKTSYYPNITQTIPRHKAISIVYDNRNGVAKSEFITDEWLSVTLQRKIDYLFGGTFLSKLPKSTCDNIIKALATNGIVANEEICPLFSTKDYFVSFTNKLIFAMVVLLLLTIFKVGSYENWIIGGFVGVVTLMIGFFFYAQHDAKKYNSCSSCQIGNNIGVMVKKITLAGIVLLLSWIAQTL
jgi:peptide deformylase